MERLDAIHVIRSKIGTMFLPKIIIIINLVGEE